MIKKIFKFIRAITIGIIWGYVYCILASTVTIYFWNFNLFSANSWKSVQAFWQHGGVIKESKDYALLFTLLALIPLYLYTWKKLCKKNFAHILLSPVILYNNYITRKYGAESPRIILKNMGRNNYELEELEKRLNPTSNAKPDVEINKIRSAVQDKIKSAIEN